MGAGLLVLIAGLLLGMLVPTLRTFLRSSAAVELQRGAALALDRMAIRVGGRSFEVSAPLRTPAGDVLISVSPSPDQLIDAANQPIAFDVTSMVHTYSFGGTVTTDFSAALAFIQASGLTQATVDVLLGEIDVELGNLLRVTVDQELTAPAEGLELDLNRFLRPEERLRILVWRPL